MTKNRTGWTAAVVMAALACLDHPPVSAADAPASELLKKYGLKIVGSLAVVETESDVRSKVSEAKRLSKQLSYLLMQQNGTLSPKDIQQNIKTITDQISQMRLEMSAVNQRMGSVPRGRRGFTNNFAAEQYQELFAYRNQLQAELQLESAFLNQLKSQAADPKAKDKIDAEVRDKRDAYHQALLDLRKLVDSANEKYEKLAKDDEFKKAFDAFGKKMRDKPRLGRSHEFLTNVKLLEKLEMVESSGEEPEPAAKPARRSRYGTKAKRSSKAAVGGQASDAAEKPGDTS